MSQKFVSALDKLQGIIDACEDEPGTEQMRAKCVDMLLWMKSGGEKPVVSNEAMCWVENVIDGMINDMHESILDLDHLKKFLYAYWSKPTMSEKDESTP